MWYLFFALALADTGLRVTMTQRGIDRAKEKIEPLVTEYLRSIEPIVVTPKQPSSSDYVNITEIQLLNTTHSGFELSIDSGRGLKGTLLGFGARMNIALFWRLPLGSWRPLNDSNATIDNANIAFQIAASADEDGKPTITFTLSSITNFTIDIGDIISDGFIKQLINEIVVQIISREAPGMANGPVNEAIEELINENWNNGTANLTNLGINATFDYRLIPPPNFTQGFASVSIQGHVTYEEKPCPGVFPELPPAEAGQDVALMVNTGLIDCVLYQVTEAKIVEQEILKAMAKANISFDDRLKLDLGLAQVPQLSFSNGTTIVAKVGVMMNIAKNLSVLVPVIGLNLNASATIKTQLDLIPHNSSVSVSLFDVGVIGLSNSYLNTTLVPKRYVEQIQNEDWGNLINKMNALLDSALANNTNFNIPIPNNYSDLILQFTHDLTISSGFNYLMISADITNSSMYK